MLSKLSKICILLTLVFLGNIAIYTQTTPSDDWMRVSSDDGEFSIEVPRSHSYFYDKNGFSVSDSGSNNPLTKMEMLNAFTDGVLVSFERYSGKKRGLDRLREIDNFRKSKNEKRSINLSGAKTDEIISKTDTSYCIQRYFATGDHIYILTTCSRQDDTATMRRFLDSVVVNSKSDGKPVAGETPFSKLTPVSVQVEDISAQKQVAPVTRPSVPMTKPVQDDNNRTLVIAVKPLASYTDEARAKRVAGTVVLKAAFGVNGFIPTFSVVRPLPGDLVRQAIFSALRMKFLPLIKDGKPEQTTKTIEYSFDIF